MQPKTIQLQIQQPAWTDAKTVQAEIDPQWSGLGNAWLDIPTPDGQTISVFLPKAVADAWLALEASPKP